jgi:hypothetical protein
LAIIKFIDYLTHCHLAFRDIWILEEAKIWVVSACDICHLFHCGCVVDTASTRYVVRFKDFLFPAITVYIYYCTVILSRNIVCDLQKRYEGNIFHQQKENGKNYCNNCGHIIVMDYGGLLGMLNGLRAFAEAMKKDILFYYDHALARPMQTTLEPFQFLLQPVLSLHIQQIFPELIICQNIYQDNLIHSKLSS